MATIISTNPGKNYEPIGEMTASSHDEVRQKVMLAQKAKDDWRRLGVAKRVSFMRNVYSVFKKHESEISDIITKEVGTPITECRGEITWDWGYFEWFLDHAEESLALKITGKDNISVHTVHFEPTGVAAVITPWNLPFDLFLWGVVPNLLAGNTVVHKASEECIITGKLLADIMEETGLPKGVFSAVHGAGDVGEYLVNQNIDLIWFTGSTEVGKKLYRIAADKFIKAILELGGSNPAIIFDDADIDGLIENIIFKRYGYGGQACDADKRLIVQKSMYDEVVEKLSARIKKIKPGVPDDPSTELGPLVSKKQLELLENQVDDAIKQGATMIQGQPVTKDLRGAYYPATILTNIMPSMRVWKEEVFGPVLSVVSFDTEEEAIQMANDTVYGLGSQVFTKDMKKAARIAREIQAGNVDVNGVGHFRPYNPFGGYKSSGMGREHGTFGFQELCQIKVISQNA